MSKPAIEKLSRNDGSDSSSEDDSGLDKSHPGHSSKSRTQCDCSPQYFGIITTADGIKTCLKADVESKSTREGLFVCLEKKMTLGSGDEILQQMLLNTGLELRHVLDRITPQMKWRLCDKEKIKLKKCLLKNYNLL